MLSTILCYCLVQSNVFGEDLADAANAVPKEIFDYVAIPEPDFAWKLEQTTELGANKVHRLVLTSQKWQGIVWKHNLVVYEPT